MVRTDERMCPNHDCYEGHLLKPCSTCSGEGLVSGESGASTCPDCYEGQVDAGPCDLCKGVGVITYALSRLYEADQFVLRNDPDWDGDDASRSGVTIYSLAKWFRQREELGPKVHRAHTRREDEELVVALEDDRGQELVVFRGLSWGYGGEGPRGLATILADVLSKQFPTIAEAMRFAQSQGVGIGWATGA
jgi:hypothetical protein